MKVLVADDVLTNRMLTVRILEKRGHLVKAAENGMEAIEALIREDFDLVLMDIQMPVMSGIEAARIIRSCTSRVHCHEVPILALTAIADSSFRMTDCLNAGMNGYLVKPIRTDEFIEIVEQYAGTDGTKRT